MRELHFGLLSFVIVTLFAVAAAAQSDCGCAARIQPCTEKTLATASLPQPVPAVSDQRGMDLVLTDCWDCGESDLAGAFLMSLVATILIVTLRRLALRRAALLIPRFDCLSGAAASPPRPGDAEADRRRLRVLVPSMNERPALFAQPVAG